MLRGKIRIEKVGSGKIVQMGNSQYARPHWGRAKKKSRPHSRRCTIHLRGPTQFVSSFNLARKKNTYKSFNTIIIIELFKIFGTRNHSRK